ncbi:MAG: hypothetical protein QOD81_4537, partial [Solirubrobacteraceae bacterium]|nr:hypothetical protein [Solirubrobacteraceae bacterium]
LGFATAATLAPGLARWETRHVFVNRMRAARGS